MTEDDVIRFQAGLAAFNRAKRVAFFQEIMGHLRGTPTELLSFADIRERLRLNVENYRGIQDVPLAKIAGSVGRAHEFTRHFLPKTKHMEKRWSRVYAQALSQEGLPPIELYQIDDVYFVRDGNHRVSVARQLGAQTIQAEVIELPTPIGFRSTMTAAEIDATACYVEFLNQLRPLHLPPGTFKLTHPTAYNDLMEHINLYHCVESHNAVHPPTLAESAARWYNQVYLPVVETIHKYQLMAQAFPTCTETDLYLWVTEQVCDYHDALPLNDFLVNYLRDRNIPIPLQN